ncbi:hypothetical protein SLEP1_g26868 [Rubroshorea leprosula]|uniref:Uncharacterized protein n=1 Tax=Rubroshorea leprosula TaxID=152421 RepID=A0AAV5JX67_9ROSI|nr:hypothetical protein SLEP1_g26868 [Rubroshorea leprosula]
MVRAFLAFGWAGLGCGCNREPSRAVVENRLLKAAASSDEMEVQRAGSRSCSWLYGQKFEDHSLARAEKRCKAGSNFAAGCLHQAGFRWLRRTQPAGSRRNPACSVSLEPSLAGFDETQIYLVLSNPARLGPVEPSLARSPLLGSDKTQQAGFRRTLLGLVEPSQAGFPKRLGFPKPNLGSNEPCWVLSNLVLLGFPEPSCWVCQDPTGFR